MERERERESAFAVGAWFMRNSAALRDIKTSVDDVFRDIKTSVDDVCRDIKTSVEDMSRQHASRSVIFGRRLLRLAHALESTVTQQPESEATLLFVRFVSCAGKSALGQAGSIWTLSKEAACMLASVIRIAI